MDQFVRPMDMLSYVSDCNSVYVCTGCVVLTVLLTVGMDTVVLSVHETP